MWRIDFFDYFFQIDNLYISLFFCHCFKIVDNAAEFGLANIEPFSTKWNNNSCRTARKYILFVNFKILSDWGDLRNSVKLQEIPQKRDDRAINIHTESLIVARCSLLLSTIYCYWGNKCLTANLKHIMLNILCRGITNKIAWL